VSDVLTPETFDFVLANELKRAARSQNFVTLVLLQPRSGDLPAALAEIAAIVTRELRETDLLATDAEMVSMVLLDADLQNSRRVIDRVMSRLEHYQFTAPVDLIIGAACCPTDGADINTLRRAALDARAELPRRAPRGTAQAQ
jgi:hypothetical protein